MLRKIDALFWGFALKNVPFLAQKKVLNRPFLFVVASGRPGRPGRFNFFYTSFWKARFAYNK